MARAVVTYHEQLLKLQPDFDDCPEPCAQAYEREESVDLPDLCATCEVRKQFEFFQREFEREWQKRFKGQKPAWSFDELFVDVNRVWRIDRELNGQGYPKACDVLTALCLDLWRSEQWRPERIAQWERAQKKPGSESQ
jgi:hypothetical protein